MNEFEFIRETSNPYIHINNIFKDTINNETLNDMLWFMDDK